MARKGKSKKSKKVAATEAPDPRARIFPVCEPPRKLLAAMVAVGAQKDEVDGEDLRVVNIEGVGSEAWELYKNWACACGEANPLVAAIFFPSPEIIQSASCAPTELCFEIQREANSIINQMKTLLFADLSVEGIPSLPEPLPDPVMMANICDAKVAVTTLLQAISKPGAEYPVLNELRVGDYVCHLHYVWRGASFIVPLFKLE